VYVFEVDGADMAHLGSSSGIRETERERETAVHS